MPVANPMRGPREGRGIYPKSQGRRSSDLSGPFLSCLTSSSKMLLLLKQLVYARDRNRSFPDGGNNSFDICRSHVPRGKNTLQTGFR